MDACNISGLNLQCQILSSNKRRAKLARNVYSQSHPKRILYGWFTRLVSPNARMLRNSTASSHMAVKPQSSEVQFLSLTIIAIIGARAGSARTCMRAQNDTMGYRPG